MPKIVPAILENTKGAFLERVSGIVKLPGLERIQVDFGDGEFIPNHILPVAEIDVLNPAFHWEAHLMVKEPKNFLDYQICGFKTILIHFEAFKNETELLKAVKEIKALGLKPGICINNATPTQVLAEFAGLVSQFQVMGVAPGFQGQKFMPETMPKVGELRKLLPSAIIEVDGGVNEANIKELCRAGADLLVVGSALVKAPNIIEAYNILLKEAKIG